MSKMLATKLHDALCPKCNNRCHCGGLCAFNPNISDAEWDFNPANSYFLELAEKATVIMKEVNITEEQLIEYAKAPFLGTYVPEDVRLSMVEHDFC